MVTAKPVVKNKFWVLRENNRKVGTVEKIIKNGYIVNLYNDQSQYTNLSSIKKQTNIVFEEPKKADKFENQVNGFPTDCKPYNGVYNVKDRLPIFTKKPKSKSWYAAGYFKILINNRTKILFCPKLILLNRYRYLGPVKSRDGFTYK